MGKGLLRLRAAVLGLAVCAGGIALRPSDSMAQFSSSSGASGGNPITSGIKQGVDKITGVFAPQKSPGQEEPADDAVALRNKGRPTASVYVAVARLYEQSGKLAEAEKQYQFALKDNASDLAALLGYARLKEQMEKPDDAIGLYRRAAKVNPNEAAVFNNLGLCLARRGTFDEAIAAIGRAVLLQPKNPLYRNNIATVLVEMGRMQEAFTHLRTVHGDAVAYYNLGYLLNRKGKTQEAAQHYAIAARLDPSLAQARNGLDRPQQVPVQAPVQAPAPDGRSSAPIRVGSRPLPPSVPGARSRAWSEAPSDLPPLPPEPSTPVRLPPVAERPPLAPPDPAEVAPLPGGAVRRPSVPIAPMPSSLPRNTAVRPLPPVE